MMDARVVRPSILDGPTGTQLIERGFGPHPELWTALAAREAPELLLAVHSDYVQAGAEILTANTFRVSSYAFAKAGLEPSEAMSLARTSLDLARKAAATREGDRRVLVAGSLAPLEDCYRPELTPADGVLTAAHAQNATMLLEAGCDVILIETMPTAREALIATRAATRGRRAPVAVSFLCEESGRSLAGGDDLLAAARACAGAGAVRVLVNCVHADVVERALAVLEPLAAEGVALGAYANGARMSRRADGSVEWTPDGTSPESYAERAAEWVRRYGLSIVGSCCGTGPDHTRALARRIHRII